MTEIPNKKKTILKGHNGPVNIVKFNNMGGRYCLSGGRDRSIRLWNPSSGSQVKKYEGHGWEVLSIAITSDNTHFASCGGDKSVFIWDVAQGAIIRRCSGHNTRINTVDFNEDGSVLASGGYDSTVRLWDMRARQRLPLQILDEASDSVMHVCISGDKIYTASVDGYVRTYDLRAGQLRSDYFDYAATSVKPTQDNSVYLVSTLDNKVRLIDTANGNLLANFEGHTSESYRARSVFGLGEGIALSTSEDGRIYSWDLLESKIISNDKAHDRAVLWLDHHPSRLELLSSGSDGIINFYTT